MVRNAKRSSDDDLVGGAEYEFSQAESNNERAKAVVSNGAACFGAAAGAEAGAAAGAVVGGPIGAAIGGIAGSLLAGFAAAAATDMVIDKTIRDESRSAQRQKFWKSREP